jgi:outer membrane protein assembly factor BamB
MTSTGMTMVSATGKVKWTLSLGTSFAGAAPSAIKGTIFAVTNEGSSRLVAVSEAGDFYWQNVLLPDQYALCAPTVSDGKLYVTSDNGKVYAYALTSKTENTVVIDYNVNGKDVSLNAYRPANYSLYTYTWSWGDGNFSKGANANHTYAQDGNYQVILTLTAPDGTSTTYTKDVKVDTSAKVNDMLIYGVIAIIGIALVIVVALVLRRRKK